MTDIAEEDANSAAAEFARSREEGAALMRARDYGRAAEAFARAARAGPDHAPTQLSLGIALQGTRRHAAALRRFEAIGVGTPQRAAAVLHAAFSHLGLGDALAARRAAGEALALTPRLATAHCAAGQAEHQLGRAEAAEAAFLAALEIDSSAADVWTLLASARKLAGDTNGAERAVMRSLRLNPAHGPALAALATMRVQAQGELRLYSPTNPQFALGMAVDYLTRKSTFAKLPFGEWGRTLAHQVGRGHQLFVVDSGLKARGFLGWALTREALAREWMAGLKGLSDEECRDGDCVSINAFAADSRPALNLLLQAMRRQFADKTAIYFKRFYRDGRSRPMRLPVNAFVVRHLARGSNKTEETGEASVGPSA